MITISDVLNRTSGDWRPLVHFITRKERERHDGGTSIRFIRNRNYLNRSKMLVDVEFEFDFTIEINGCKQIALFISVSHIDLC